MTVSTVVFKKKFNNSIQDFENEAIIEHGFFYLSYYHYDKLFKLLFNKKEKTIQYKMKRYPDIRTAAEKNEVEVIYSFLLQMQEISEKLFYSTKIKQIIIPIEVTEEGIVICVNDEHPLKAESPIEVTEGIVFWNDSVISATDNMWFLYYHGHSLYK